MTYHDPAAEGFARRRPRQCLRRCHWDESQEVDVENDFGTGFTKLQRALFKKKMSIY